MGASPSKDDGDVDNVNFTPKIKSQRKSALRTNGSSFITKDSSKDESVSAPSTVTQSNVTSYTPSPSRSTRTPAARTTRSSPQRTSRSAKKAISTATESTAAMSETAESPSRYGTSKKSSGASTIADDEVQVNLAMADLMAYLQVVANNSGNLPLTRRDDPELGKTVSTLTADEYARKSAAFIPSDVRIIGGSFTKYGRVWDLPTSDEYSPADGAQEPGRSHGGACCNALLKVLYDAESDAADANDSDFMNPDNLFDEDDDDDDDDDEPPSALASPTKSFESLVLADVSTPSTLTWTTLLRKMKFEMEEIGFAQAPTVTSSRKFDLNKPFTLIPPGFDPSRNKKRSLLIGCNYSHVPEAALKASHDDIRSMKDYIVNVHGFPETKGLMTVLLDDEEHKHPTHLNITEAFKALSEQSRPGDAVFVQFSGHGCRILDSAIDSEAESYDEAIIPVDFGTSGLIRDTLIFKTLLAPMRYGVTVTILIDCCDTGVMVDLPYAWATKNDRPEILAKMSLNDDFSFMRFLKVVKTLYESSVFTQLGRTVGSALNNEKVAPAAAPAAVQQAPVVREYEEEETVNDDDDTLGNGSLITMEEDDDTKRRPKPETPGLFTMLGACHFPGAGALTPRRKMQYDAASTKSKSPKSKSGSDRPPATPQSFIEQVINCSFHARTEDSDDDTFHHNPHDEDSYGDTIGAETYDSGEDYSSRGRTRSRR